MCMYMIYVYTYHVYIYIYICIYTCSATAFRERLPSGDSHGDLTITSPTMIS